MMDYLQGHLTPRTTSLFQSLDDSARLLRFLNGSRMTPEQLLQIRNSLAQEGPWHQWVHIVDLALQRLAQVDDDDSDSNEDDDDPYASEDDVSEDIASEDTDSANDGMYEEEENDEEDE